MIKENYGLIDGSLAAFRGSKIAKLNKNDNMSLIVFVD